MKKILCIAFLTAALVSGCSSSVNMDSRYPKVAAPHVDMPTDNSVTVTLANGADIILQKIDGKLFFETEATFNDTAFAVLLSHNSHKPAAERRAIVSREIKRIFDQVKTAKAIPATEIPEVGYMTFWLPYQEGDDLFASLKSLNIRNLLVNPVVTDRFSLPAAKAHTPKAEGLEVRSLRAGTDEFSGLKRIHAPEFVAMAEEAIGDGVKVDGSSVNLGITDTGMTLNHPTFTIGGNRVTYMKDFTREGRVYFNHKAKLQAAVSEANPELLVLSGEIILTPRLPSLPAGDVLIPIDGLTIKPSKELRDVLLNPSSGAKLGILLEEVLNSSDDKVDLNANGKQNDKFFFIFVPGATATEDVVYADFSGEGDFSNVKPVGDWNTTKQSLKVHSELIGFDIRKDKLPKADGTDVMEVRSISIVGYDPGNHGTHVAGIAGGACTIASHCKGTLARGVAPAAKLLMNRVCANNGGCNAMQAFIDLALNGQADVINMSLGGLNPFNDGFGVEETMINRLTSATNTLFVISAGNSGPGKQTVGSPSVARLSLSVGATATKGLIQRQYQWPGGGAIDDSADSDFMMFFSSRGPTAAGGFKPSISAPGTELSSVQLNGAPGTLHGLDVYWGTSMAAPTATGAYALLLDAIRKYNAKHPGQELTDSAAVLREVLISTARPFDATRFDPETGTFTQGQYTWADQGTGMVDLVAAWKKLFELRDAALPSSLVELPLDLDYEIYVPMTSPNGIKYDGSRGAEGTPAIGTGLYLDFYGTETVRQIHIGRRLPFIASASQAAGELERLLVTTADEFVLKTVYYGSDKAWMKVGTNEQLNCEGSDEANLMIVGRGAELLPTGEDTASVVPSKAATLNVCLKREMIANELPTGDHGALIYAYRTVDGKVSPVPSFIVPVYLTVPHRVLAESTGYETEGTVKSFGVSRNYVKVPAGTTLVKVTLEVPEMKTQRNGRIAAGEHCSGVELMSLEGLNTAKSFNGRAAARIANCTAQGAPSNASRVLTFTRENPRPGIWDLHVFGSYAFEQSKYKLRVDYVTAKSNVSSIKGSLAALNGSLQWTVQESTFPIAPDSEKSKFELKSFAAVTKAKVASKEQVLVESPLGTLRRYSPAVKVVEIRTGGAPGNDIDLHVFECPANLEQFDPAACTVTAESTGSTDEESVKIKPGKDKAYAVVVDGYSIKNDGAFSSTEIISLPSELGELRMSGSAPVFTVQYAMTQVATSTLLNDTLFTSGKYKVVGTLTLMDASETALTKIPVEISNQ